MGNVPSPLLHDGIIYSIRNAGILSSIDAKTGEILKQGRVPDALAAYYASPVAADGKIFLLDLDATLSVVTADAQWEVIHTLALNESSKATPAIVDGRLYVRTDEHLYCFGE
jgi:outer membrane protein assembly factor BamB